MSKTLLKPKSPSLLQIRFRRFRRIKRGWYSFLAISLAYLGSFLLPFFIGNRPLAVEYKGELRFPAFRSYLYETFSLGSNNVYLGKVFDQRNEDGSLVESETRYRELAARFHETGEGWILMPFFPYGPNEPILDRKGNPPFAPDAAHWFGTDDRGRDVLVRLAYGFRVSITFSLIVTACSYAIAVAVGGMLGFAGGWLDIFGVRFLEIWGSIPFLYTVIIMASIFGTSFLLLGCIFIAFSWLGLVYYMRGEFLRERNRDYVAAAVAVGEGQWAIIFSHILPNALTPIITFAPFTIVAEITSLVALDFLGFGVPAPTPSWGELLGQWKSNYTEWHLAVFPLTAMFLTLQLIVFIGEAVREAFDPKVYSRLR